jgi:hypothetical protein
VVSRISSIGGIEKKWADWGRRAWALLNRYQAVGVNPLDARLER